ncbi:hypothetical protein ACFPFM_19355 [Saccharothrix xinjiangensis]|uniref:Uncharacterized protein n=1 Tax=Saccharothrix xinjiangensis TaxID=204798 RepID=A0ABV9Y024_9PSEU
MDIEKIPASTAFGDLTPDLPVVDAGAQAHLTWTARMPAAVTHYAATLSWDTDLEHRSETVTTDHSYTDRPHRDTTYLLTADITDTGCITTHPALSTFVTVARPHLNVTDCTVRGAARVLGIRERQDIHQKFAPGQIAPPVTRTAGTDGLLSIILATSGPGRPSVGVTLTAPDRTCLFITTATARSGPGDSAPCLTVPVPAGATITVTDTGTASDYSLSLDWRPLGTGILTPSQQLDRSERT